MARVIGVDLGTTDSCVTVMEGQAPRGHRGYGHTKRLALSVASVAESVVGASVSTAAIDQEGNLPGETWEKAARRKTRRRRGRSGERH
jgi:molecular chaperone DnaK (HSP70)